MSLIIEEPAWDCGASDPVTGACSLSIRIYWTDKSELDNVLVGGLTDGSPLSAYYYIGALMIHEFGHTLGLPDFGNHPHLATGPQ